MANSRKVEEALGHIREAEKCLKTGFLKWKPDYDQAADEYNYAATCYKTMRQHVQCRDCLFKAAENYQICKTYFSAAKCYEQAALISKELGETARIGELSEKAAVLYRNHGVPETAVIALEKGAKMLEIDDPDKSLHLYKFAVDIISTEDRIRQAAEVQSKVSKLLVKLKRYQEAIESIQHEIAFQQSVNNKAGVARLAVSSVMCHIATGDNIAAEKCFRDWGGDCEDEEARTLISMLEAFDQADEELAKRALNQPFIQHMDIEYARLAKELLKMIPSAPKKKSVPPGSSNEPAPNDDDEEELNLC